MPAAELIRLRQQINQLIAAFAQPADFCRLLRELLNLYAHHSYRPGQAIQPQPLLPTYRVPPLVMRQLSMELGKTCQEQPQQALEVVSAMWHESFLEPRLLAALMLGSIPLQGPGSAGTIQGVLDRLRSWGTASENLRLIRAMMEDGTRLLRHEAPERLLELIDTWLVNANPAQQSVGIHAIIALANDKTYENLPALFRLLGPPVQNVHPRLQADLQLVLQAMIKRSPTETAYFLRQALSLSVGTGTARLIRRLLPEFDAAQQANLRAVLGSRSAG
jgi:hypothetical protein